MGSMAFPSSIVFQALELLNGLSKYVFRVTHTDGADGAAARSVVGFGAIDYVSISGVLRMEASYMSISGGIKFLLSMALFKIMNLSHY